MKIKSLMSILVLLTTLTGGARSEPLNVIIVTRDSAESERGYTEFLQDIYRGNVSVHIAPNRYEEYLSANKKLELESADLIIISWDNGGGSFNGDSDFWNEVNVPILNHNIKIARSGKPRHRYWDWLDGNKTDTNPCTHLDIADANDEIFAGVDTTSGTVEIFTTGKEIDHSDQTSAGYGTVVATSASNVVIARWLGSEPNYYDGSDYTPGAPRVFFAMPKMTYEFFDVPIDYSYSIGKTQIVKRIVCNQIINQVEVIAIY